MKKFLSFICVLLLCFSFPKDALAKEKTLTVGFDQNFPPFGFVQNDEFVGFDIDLAKEVGKRMGYKVVFQPIDWDSKDLELSSGTIDCIWNGFTINGRENQYTWSKPYLNNAQVVVVKKSSKINKLDDLKNKIVAVQKESSAQSALEDVSKKDLKDSFKSFIKVADYNSGLMDLESGGIDALAMDKYVAKYQLKGKLDTYQILEEELSTEQYGIGFLKGNTALRDKVQKEMDALIKDGTFDKLSDKWFGSNETKDESSSLISSLKQLSSGMLTTIKIFVLTLLFSLPLGLLIALGRMSKNRLLRGLIKIYISFMRGTPLMLQMLVVYFGPYYLFNINISSGYRGVAVIIAFVLNYAAYFAEIYRSGIASMDKGQYEAAKVLGYNSFQTFFVIIMPQVIKRILPSITNEVITLVKDTSLAFSIAYAEMFTLAKALAANTRSMIPFVAAAIFYYVFNFIVAEIMELFERKLNYYE